MERIQGAHELFGLHDSHPCIDSPAWKPALACDGDGAGYVRGKALHVKYLGTMHVCMCFQILTSCCTLARHAMVLVVTSKAAKRPCSLSSLAGVSGP